MVQGNSQNIPQCNTMQHRNQQYAQPKKQAKEPCKGNELECALECTREAQTLRNKRSPAELLIK